MHYIRKALAGIAFPIALALPSGALPQGTSDPPPRDPVAMEIISNAAKFLNEQTEISVKWFVSYDDIIEGREKITHTRSGSNLMMRDVGFYAYSESGLKTREFFFDGTSLTIADPDQNAYAQVLFNDTYNNLVDRIKKEYGVDLPIWAILSDRYKDHYIEAAESVAYLGLTRIGGELAHHIALTNYDEDWQLWVADDPESPRLLMMAGTDPYTQGWPQYRTYFTSWDFTPEIADGVFSYIPDEDSERMSWPKVPSE